MQSLTTKTVREIALELPITTRIFEEFHIDYCCGGRKMFLDACRNAGADPEAVLQKIDSAIGDDETADIAFLITAPLSEVIDYIERKHHTYTREELDALPPLMEKVAHRHGELHPELTELKYTFATLCDELRPHLLKEESILFPFVRELDSQESGEIRLSPPFFGTVENPIRVMMTEHDMAGELLQNMRAISKDYLLPEGACPSYTALYSRLEAFERDLHQHIHLENNLLFPKALELERKIFP